MTFAIALTGTILSQSDHANACALYRYWQALEPEKPRRAIDPLAVGAKLIAHLNLLSRVADDFRYDLVGTVLQNAVPRLKTGVLARTIMDIDPTRDFIYGRFKACADSAKPQGFRAQYETVEGKPVACLAFVYPLDITAGGADSLLVGMWICHADANLMAGERRNQIIEDVPAWLFGG